MKRILQLTCLCFRCSEIRDPKCKPRALTVEVFSVTMFLFSFTFSSKEENKIQLKKCRVGM